jgi:hypothetical protein
VNKEKEPFVKGLQRMAQSERHRDNGSMGSKSDLAERSLETDLHDVAQIESNVPIDDVSQEFQGMRVSESMDSNVMMQFPPSIGSTIPYQPMANTLIITNLPYRVRWQELKDLFRRFGHPSRSEVLLGPDSRSRGIGYVVMSSYEEALRCVSGLKDYEWFGRTIQVSLDTGGYGLSRAYYPPENLYATMRQSSFPRQMPVFGETLNQYPPQHIPNPFNYVPVMYPYMDTNPQYIPSEPIYIPGGFDGTPASYQSHNSHFTTTSTSTASSNRLLYIGNVIVNYNIG